MTTMNEPVAQTAGLRAVLQNGPFLRLWLAQALSQTAQQMISYVLLVQVAAISQSSAAVSGIMIAFALPGILFSALAGIYVDRRAKRTVLVMTNAGRTLALLGYILLTSPVLRFDPLLVLYITALVFASVSQFFMPAEGAAIPLLVGRDHLLPANSLFNLTFTASQLLGFLLLGPLCVKVLVHGTDFGAFYAILAGLFLACTLLTAMLPRGEQVKPATQIDGVGSAVQSVLADLREGWQYIRNDAAIYSAIIQSSVATAVVLMLGVIGPRFLAEEVGIPASDLYLVLAPGGIGLGIGVALVGRFSTEANRMRMISLATFAAGLGLLAFAALSPAAQVLAGLLGGAAATHAWVLGAMMVLVLILGALNSFVTVPAQTVLQERARDDVRARVLSAFNTVSNIGVTAATFFAGALADAVGVAATVGLIGMGVAGVAAWGIRQATAPARRRVPAPMPARSGTLSTGPLTPLPSGSRKAA
jgi:MFS family permease